VVIRVTISNYSVSQALFSSSHTSFSSFIVLPSFLFTSLYNLLTHFAYSDPPLLAFFIMFP